LYPALLPLMAHTSAGQQSTELTPRPPGRFKWTRSVTRERRNLVSAHVPSHFKRGLLFLTQGLKKIIHIRLNCIVTVSLFIFCWNQLRRLEPFGVGNRESRFIILGAKIRKPEAIGVDRIKYIIADRNTMVRAIEFPSASIQLSSAIMKPKFAANR